MRYALYFTPPSGDPLAVAAAHWLGRDAFTGEMLQPPALPMLGRSEIAFHTAPPRRYGFHATLKAPFRLAEGLTEADLAKAVTEFAAERDAFAIPRLKIARLDGFFALIPEAPLPELSQFAADVVQAFDRFRAPLTDAEIQRRNPDSLAPHEMRNLVQWGYPHVFDSFQFHMTLTGRVQSEEAPTVLSALEAVFAPLIRTPVRVTGLALFVEPEDGAPFKVLDCQPLRSGAERKIA